MDKLSAKMITTLSLLILVIVGALISVTMLFFGQTNSLSNDVYRTNDQTKSAQGFGRNFSHTNMQALGDVADSNYQLSFPKDHDAHASFDIEWWYLTANLQDEFANSYNVQWTLFRFRNPTASNGAQTSTSETDFAWSDQQMYMAHASVHSGSQHWFSEKFARGNVGNAGVQGSPFALFMDNWRWESTTQSQDLLPATLQFDASLVNASEEVNDVSLGEAKITLSLSNMGPFVLQGDEGYSIKSKDGQHASHYYSAPFMWAEGSISVNEKLAPIKVSGNAWFDQEWTSQLFDQTTMGWDWLSLHLDNGDKVMAFRMRLNGQNDYITGTYINADGTASTLQTPDVNLSVIEKTRLGSKLLPLHWQLSIPSKNLDIAIVAAKQDQWNPALIAYYEGAVAVSGTHSGKGFLELTGY